MSSTFEATALALLSLKGVGPITALKILDRPGLSLNSDDILRELEVHSRRGQSIPSVGRFEDALSQSELLIKQSEADGIRTIGFTHAEYPTQLTDIPNPPPILFVRGSVELLSEARAVAIVGTRHPSNYGSQCAFRIAKRMTERDISVVSGLALGVDTEAHKGCLDSEGKTVAVLPGGLDRVSPRSNIKLADQIEKYGGALVSEYPIGVEPRTPYFVQRNRIQSGLAAAVIVVETKVDGGTMKTASFAQKQNRFLAVITHPERFDGDQAIQGNKALLAESGDLVIRISDDKDLENLIEKIT